MNMMRLNDFQGKEVINACDGKKLGYIVDFVFDVKFGQSLFQRHQSSVTSSVTVPNISFLTNAFAKSDQMSYW